MVHKYEAHGNDGQSYTVTTSHHHDDHDDKTFKQHLLDVIKGALGGVAATAINRFIYKGKH